MPIFPPLWFNGGKLAIRDNKEAVYTMPNWQLATLWGIQRGDADDSATAWHAGRLFDVLRVGPISGNPLLVADDASGVWAVNEAGGLALSLSWDWDVPSTVPTGVPLAVENFTSRTICLAQGIYSPEHIYAGGAALYETDATNPAPLSLWREIPIRGGDVHHTLKTGTIHRILVLHQLNKLVLACDFGVFWATIPPPGGNYIFTRVTSLPGNRFSGLAEGPENRVIAAAWGTDLKDHNGIFVGEWKSSTDPLVFHRATISGNDDLDVEVWRMLRIDVAACANNRHVLYAVSGGGGDLTLSRDSKGNFTFDDFANVQWDGDTFRPDDFIYRVLRSDDGGETWFPTGRAVAGEALPLFPGDATNKLAGHTQAGYVGCVGVSPVDPDIVAVGMVKPFLSQDGGKNWVQLASPHLHADTHGLVFDPIDAQKLYVCCDGGLATTPDLGKTWNSATNRQLPNLEFYRCGLSPRDSGLIAGSLQDNGNQYAQMYINTVPWKELDAGDGVLTMFVKGGELIRENNTLKSKNPSGTEIEWGRQARAARWDAGAQQFQTIEMFPDSPLSNGVIPVDGTTDGLTRAKTPNDDSNVAEIVAAPVFANEVGEPMVAVDAEGEMVFGLFARSDGKFHWKSLGTVPHKPDTDPAGNELPYFATASAATPDGRTVFVGMNNGQLFGLDPAKRSVQDLFDPIISVPITRFAAPTSEHLFMIAGEGVFRHDLAGWKQLTGKVLPGSVSAFLPTGQTFVALEADPTNSLPVNAPPPLYVATAAGVWSSLDDGESWFPFSPGLPKVPNCQDLRFVQETSGVTFLYLATFGWSVFRRALNFEKVLQPVKVDGHMDLTDRGLLDFVTGTDYTLVTFADSRMLGSLHPFEEMTFAGDEKLGGEIHVDLKLSFAWKTDLSVVLTVSADLKDRDDDEVDAHGDGTVTIPLGAAESVVIDLESGEFEPDQAHIEFTVTNG